MTYVLYVMLNMNNIVAAEFPSLEWCEYAKQDISYDISVGKSPWNEFGRSVDEFSLRCERVK